MTTKQVADRLVELCRDGKNKQALDELYAPFIQSTEMFGTPEMPQVMNGIDAIRAKTQWWLDNHEVHSATCGEPIVAGNHFAVTMRLDVTFKPRNQRMQMEEICVYEVKDGKISKEQFFYSMP
jgi:hypothetical protein